MVRSPKSKEKPVWEAAASRGMLMVLHERVPSVRQVARVGGHVLSHASQQVLRRARPLTKRRQPAPRPREQETLVHCHRKRRDAAARRAKCSAQSHTVDLRDPRACAVRVEGPAMICTWQGRWEEKS
eukprot:scaffold2797_cov112-Isochrysis_galbana.AAC.5